MTKKKRIALIDGAQILEIRAKRRLTQSQFWSPLGATQSGGSRYEGGRNIPKPVQLLLTIAYGTPKQSEAVSRMLRETPNSTNEGKV